MDLIFLATLGITALPFAVLVWRKISLAWLSLVAELIIYSYPFERIPSLLTPFGPLRIGQVLTALGFAFLVILVLKKDAALARLKFHSKALWMLLFFAFSLPSMLYVLNEN